jgi:hypothetical protein
MATAGPRPPPAERQGSARGVSRERLCLSLVPSTHFTLYLHILTIIIAGCAAMDALVLALYGGPQKVS